MNRLVILLFAAVSISTAFGPSTEKNACLSTDVNILIQWSRLPKRTFRKAIETSCFRRSDKYNRFLDKEHESTHPKTLGDKVGYLKTESLVMACNFNGGRSRSYKIRHEDFVYRSKSKNRILELEEQLPGLGYSASESSYPKTDRYYSHPKLPAISVHVSSDTTQFMHSLWVNKS